MNLQIVQADSEQQSSEQRSASLSLSLAWHNIVIVGSTNAEPIFNPIPISLAPASHLLSIKHDRRRCRLVEASAHLSSTNSVGVCCDFIEVI